jgi:acyl carrier protein
VTQPEGDRRPELLRELTGMLVEIMGEDLPAVGITAQSRLDDDLGLSSVDLAAFGERLRRRYGERVDLDGFLAGMELDEIIELTVGRLTEHVAGRLAEPHGAG